MNDSIARGEEWNTLQRQIIHLRLGLIVLAIALVAVALTAWMARPRVAGVHDSANPGASGVMRTHGVIVVDAQGHDRILIGVPGTVSSARSRKDDDGNDMVFLGADGADRLVVGQIPSPMVNGKVGPRRNGSDNFGVSLHDTHGNERGGMGFMGNGMAVMGLDRAAPLSDAIAMVADDKSGFTGFVLNYADAHAESSALEISADAKGALFQINGKDGLPRATLHVEGDGKPAWQMDDAASAAKAAKAAEAAQTTKH